MYIVAISVKSSSIHGSGVFADKDILAGEIVWKYNPKHDLSFTVKEYSKFNEAQKEDMHKYAYLSPTSGLWICPPADDQARYTNHSKNNNLSTKFDPKLSPEPYFIANRDIKAGEELTNNYNEFDKSIKNAAKPGWL